MALWKRKTKKKQETSRYTVGAREQLVPVHTMPAKFLSNSGSDQKKPHYTFIIVIGLIVVGGVAVATILTLNNVLAPQPQPVANTTTTNTNDANINSNVNTNLNVSGNQVVKVEVKNNSSQVIGSATMIIPEGALEPGIKVDIVGFLPDANLGSDGGYNISQVLGGAYSFTPDGLSFKKPITLILQYTQEQLQQLEYREGDLKIAFGQSFNNWELISASSVDNNTKTVSVVLKDLVSQGKYGIISLNALKSEQSNSNQSSSSNENTNTNTSENLSFEAEGLLPSSTDADGDKLTDVEEDLYKTALNQPDTDKDGYVDGEELPALFDPLVANGALLAKSTVIETFTNTILAYTVLHPKDWVAKEVDSEGKAYFTSATGEFVQINGESNPSRLTAEQWYATQVPEINTSQLEKVTVGDLQGVKSVDGRTVYLAAGDKIFTISYSVGLRQDMNFYTTFTMMVNSFQLVPGANTVPDSNTNTNNSNNNQNSS